MRPHRGGVAPRHPPWRTRLCYRGTERSEMDWHSQPAGWPRRRPSNNDDLPPCDEAPRCRRTEPTRHPLNSRDFPKSPISQTFCLERPRRGAKKPSHERSLQRSILPGRCSPRIPTGTNNNCYCSVFVNKTVRRINEDTHYNLINRLDCVYCQ